MSNFVPELFGLPNVISDCRPSDMSRSVRICSGCGVMKRVINGGYTDPYKEYTSYPEPTGRTKKILEFVNDRMPIPRLVLDIGCGEGKQLAGILEYSGASIIDGYEPNSTNPKVLKTRPSDKYDLITLFQVLEHVEDLHEMLAYIKSSLTENGHLLIQVPYTCMWPFDLVVADHEWHFTKKSLKALLMKNGFFPIIITNEVIRKEITVLATPSDKLSPLLIHNPEFEKECREAIDWILRWKAHLDSINEPVAIYGTSVSAIWTAMILGDKVQCYVDDDENRLGEFNGKRVHSPYSVTIPIVAPFADWQLAEIKKKHPDLVLV